MTTISLTEHERTVRRLSDELASYRRERVRIVRVFDDFRRGPVTLSTLQPVLDLADELCDGRDVTERRWLRELHTEMDAAQVPQE
jgi:hypothetical protein